MRKIVLVILAGAAALIFIQVERYISTGTMERRLKDQARNFPSLFAGNAQNGGSPELIREIVANMASEIEDVTIERDAVEVIAIPLEVGPGNFDCSVAPFPPEYKKLSRLDQGNVQNITLRCYRDVSIVGFRAQAKTDDGARIALEGFTYARGFVH